jgi:hypothetical protein
MSSNYITVNANGKSYKISNFDAYLPREPEIDGDIENHDGSVSRTIQSTFRIEDDEYEKEINHFSSLVVPFSNREEEVLAMSGDFDLMKSNTAYFWSETDDETERAIMEYIEDDKPDDMTPEEREAWSRDMEEAGSQIHQFIGQDSQYGLLPEISKEVMSEFISNAEPSMVDEWIQLGGDVNAHDGEPLRSAGRYDKPDIAEHLLAAGAEPTLEIAQQSRGEAQDLIQSKYEQDLLRRHLPQASSDHTQTPSIQPSRRPRL